MSDPGRPTPGSHAGAGPHRRPPGTFRIGTIGGSDVLVTTSWFVVAGLIAVMMVVGAIETWRSGTRSMVLDLPLGWPIAIAALLAAWLACVVLLSALDALRAREP